MTDLEYLNHAEAALQAVELACDQINETSDADIDNQRSGGMITLTFANKSQIVMNLQKPLQEIWLAAKAGGYHYKYVDGQWLDTKNAADLFFVLTREASAQAGQVVLFSS